MATVDFHMKCGNFSRSELSFGLVHLGALFSHNPLVKILAHFSYKSSCFADDQCVDNSETCEQDRCIDPGVYI